VGPQAAHAAANPAFPRLAIWWPNSDTQPAADLARCDWIALQNYDAHHIAELRALNPSIIVLGSTSAREVNYSLKGYNDPTNVELRSVSTDWILTQVGSKLTADITASTTSIPVADVTKFAVGEMVLVDQELMHIEAISGSTLTVMARGPVNPPAADTSGTRIASVVSHWAGSISMDLSTNCPTRDVGSGPETWSDWSVRRAHEAVDSATWDGLLVDCLESDIHWMVTNGDVRSIDPRRSNMPVTDGYAAFDAVWIAGAGGWGNALRAACGTKILVGNNNMKNYALNGVVFEEYPYAGLSLKNWTTVFVGPFDGLRASYPEWCASAAAPNLTTLQTYGAANNYQLMRYGLCSSLMSDGFFSYALSSSGHARNGLFWFDEYDNAGAGRGYLGQPTGAAFAVGNAWRRDYAGGIALVNPTTSPVTVQLGGTFRKIKGAQAPTVNDGSLVTAVTIPARDGIIVLRIAPDSAPVAFLRASSATLAYGRGTTLRVLVGPSATATVRIEQRPAGSSQWQPVTTMSTDAQGTAQLSRTPLVTTEYRAVLVDAGASSNVVKVGVRHRATIRTSSRTVRRTRSVVLSGLISPSGRVKVALQRSIGGKWRFLKWVTTSSSGRYAVKVAFSRRGTFAFRVSVKADSRNLATASSTVRVRVR
jgi:5-hydroxyisourate hydrolase-like protein (transthyretin family)